MEGQYEVLTPWADVDPVAPKGICPRVTDLNGKTIGLFSSVFKVASRPVSMVAEKRLKERFPDLKFSWFESEFNLEVMESEEKDRFEEWVQGVDAVVTAVGD
jgi:hypothetical protein